MRTSPTSVLPFLAIAVSIALAPLASAEQTVGEPGRDDRGKNPLRNVYFGEQHLHTQASPDSFSVGNRGNFSAKYSFSSIFR